MELTDYQIKICKIIDAMRWNDRDHLHPYNLILLRKAHGNHCPVTHFEAEQAVEFLNAWGMDPPPRPADPYLASPWMKTWGVDKARADQIILEPVDWSWFES